MNRRQQVSAFFVIVGVLICAYARAEDDHRRGVVVERVERDCAAQRSGLSGDILLGLLFLNQTQPSQCLRLSELENAMSSPFSSYMNDRHDGFHSKAVAAVAIEIGILVVAGQITLIEGW